MVASLEWLYLLLRDKKSDSDLGSEALVLQMLQSGNLVPVFSTKLGETLLVFAGALRKHRRRKVRTQPMKL